MVGFGIDIYILKESDIKILNPYGKYCECKKGANKRAIRE